MNDPGQAYREFIAGAAAEIVAQPEDALSLLAGLRFTRLKPHLFQKVREGSQRFGLPAERVEEDLSGACASRRRSLGYRAYFWLIRPVRIALLAIRVAWGMWVVAPWRFREIRRQAQAEDGPALKPGPPEPDAPAAGDLALNSAPAAGSSGRPPRMSIVVLSYDRLIYLRQTIRAVIETAGDELYELIVVDNGSQDGSVEFLKDAHRRGQVAKLVLCGENLGTSAGYNRGFAAADDRSECLMKLDGDIRILSPGWMGKAADFLAAQPRVAFACLNQVNHPVIRTLPRFQLGGRSVMDFSAWPAGGAMIVPRRTRQELGDFIEEGPLKYVPDDIDYCARACRKGYQVVFFGDLQVYHQVDLDKTKYRRYARGKPAVDSAALALSLARDYDRGTRPLEVHYAKQESLGLPG